MIKSDAQRDRTLAQIEGFRRALATAEQEKPDPGDVDGYWVEPDEGVYDRIDPYWIDFDLIPIPQVRKWKWRMWADHGVEFFIHPAMQASPEMGFPEFFRKDRDGQPRGVIQVVKAARS